jgi:Beta/Gamma crystallin
MMATKKTSTHTKKTHNRIIAKVTFYEAVNKRGLRFVATASINNLKSFIGKEGQGKGFWNDRISGLVVVGGTCTVYQSVNYTGPSKNFPPGRYPNLWKDENLRSWDRQISSFQITLAT